jgi:multidrug resistance protein, MATE family
MRAAFRIIPGIGVFAFGGTAMSMAGSQAVATADDNRWSAHLKATLLLGLPLIGAQLAQVGINTTDVIIVGQLGAEKLAAIVLGSQFFFTLLIFGSGFSYAVVPMVAQAYGRNDTVSIRRSVRMGLWASIAYSLLSLLLFFNAETILLALGQVPEVARLAGEFLKIAGIGIFPALGFNVLRSLVSAIGRAGIILYVTLVMLISNAVLAYALVLGHFGLQRLELQGAAIVATCVHTLGFLILVFYVQTRAETRAYDLFVRFWRPDWPGLIEVVRLGMPIAITILAEVSLFTAASLLMGWIGTIELAAHGIALQLASIAFMIPLGMSQAATVRVGVAHGRGDFEALVRASLTILGLTVVTQCTGAALFATMPRFLGSLYLDTSLPEAPAVLDYATKLIMIAAIFQLMDGMQAVGAGLLRGMKDARIPMILALISYWPIGLLLAYVLAFKLGFGGAGIWYGFMVGLGTAATALLVRFYLLVKREKRWMAEMAPVSR